MNRLQVRMTTLSVRPGTAGPHSWYLLATYHFFFEHFYMAWKPGVTVAAVIERNNTFLMVEELIDGQRVINQPAGHLNDNESFVEAVIREVREETAWTFQPDALLSLAASGKKTHLHKDDLCWQRDRSRSGSGSGQARIKSRLVYS